MTEITPKMIWAGLMALGAYREKSEQIKEQDRDGALVSVIFEAMNDAREPIQYPENWYAPGEFEKTKEFKSVPVWRNVISASAMWWRKSAYPSEKLIPELFPGASCIELAEVARS